MYRLISFIIKVINDKDFTVSLEKHLKKSFSVHLSFSINIIYGEHFTVSLRKDQKKNFSIHLSFNIKVMNAEDFTAKFRKKRRTLPRFIIRYKYDIWETLYCKFFSSFRIQYVEDEREDEQTHTGHISKIRVRLKICDTATISSIIRVVFVSLLWRSVIDVLYLVFAQFQANPENLFCIFSIKLAGYLYNYLC